MRREGWNVVAGLRCLMWSYAITPFPEIYDTLHSTNYAYCLSWKCSRGC
ncbi:hypothetical protein ACHAXS_000990, partial [Conticribra weissflogii]